MGCGCPCFLFVLFWGRLTEDTEAQYRYPWLRLPRMMRAALAPAPLRQCTYLCAAAHVSVHDICRGVRTRPRARLDGVGLGRPEASGGNSASHVRPQLLIDIQYVSERELKPHMRSRVASPR